MHSSVGATGSISKSSQIISTTPTSKFDVTQTAAGYVIPATQRVLGTGDWDGKDRFGRHTRAREQWNRSSNG
jgi:hypothetical protein